MSEGASRSRKKNDCGCKIVIVEKFNAGTARDELPEYKQQSEFCSMIPPVVMMWCRRMFPIVTTYSWTTNNRK